MPHSDRCSRYCAKQHCTWKTCTNDALHGTKRCTLHSHRKES